MKTEQINSLADQKWRDLIGKRVIAKDSDGNLSPGVYTGFSTITDKHHVSFYNGDIGKFKKLTDIQFRPESGD